MKNFLDQLDIKQQHITVTVKLQVIGDNGFPGAGIRVNQNVIEYVQLLTTVEQQFKVELKDIIEIEISMIGKEYSQTQETALIIESVDIDGFEIVPKWIHLAVYDSERGLQGPTSYLGINGSWKLVIDRPFYQWRHQITGQGWLLEPGSYEES
jgi:hypothetical protein